MDDTRTPTQLVGGQRGKGCHSLDRGDSSRKVSRGTTTVYKGRLLQDDNRAGASLAWQVPRLASAL